MSWSSPLRVLGVYGLWFAVVTGCGGNPSVSNVDPNEGGGGGSGGTSSTTGGTSNGGPDLNTSGQPDMSEAGMGTGPSNYVCGNGVLEPGEFCDDGNTASDDGCSSDCKTLDPDYDCSKLGEACVKVVVCGDGVIEGD